MVFGIQLSSTVPCIGCDIDLKGKNVVSLDLDNFKKIPKREGSISPTKVLNESFDFVWTFVYESCCYGPS